MMKQAVVIVSLVSGALAGIAGTCIDINFNSANNVLSAKCMPKDQSGHVSTELDLNACFGYDGTKITDTRNGNFGTSCSGCHTYIAPDPIYSTDTYWMSCTCKGQSAEVSVNLEVHGAYQYISNNDGRLTC